MTVPMVALADSPPLGPHRELGRALREARKQQHLRQVDAAKQSGVSQAYWNKLEYGHRRPTPETLHAIARALGANYTELAKLAGFTEDTAADLMPVRPGYRRILDRLQERYLPDELTAIERGLARLLVRAETGERIAGDEGDSSAANGGPDAEPNGTDRDGISEQ